MDITSAFVFGVIVLFALVMTFFAFTRRSMPISFLAAIAWLLLLIYTRANPLPNMDTGSAGDEIILWVCILMMPMLLFNGYIKYRQDRDNKKVAYYNEAGDYVGRHEVPPAETENQGESPEQYRARVHGRVMFARKNRRRFR